MTSSSISIVKLVPSTGKHIRNVTTGDIAEGAVYLGKNDSASNYEEVDETTYRAWLEEQAKEAEEEAKQAEQTEEAETETAVVQATSKEYIN